MVSTLLGSVMLAGTSVSTSVLLISLLRKLGLDLSAQVDGVMITYGCFEGSVKIVAVIFYFLHYTTK